jgi:hypothetical protein
MPSLIRVGIGMEVPNVKTPNTMVLDVRSLGRRRASARVRLGVWDHERDLGPVSAESPRCHRCNARHWGAWRCVGNRVRRQSPRACAMYRVPFLNQRVCRTRTRTPTGSWRDVAAIGVKPRSSRASVVPRTRHPIRERWPFQPGQTSPRCACPACHGGGGSPPPGLRRLVRPPRRRGRSE